MWWHSRLLQNCCILAAPSSAKVYVCLNAEQSNSSLSLQVCNFASAGQCVGNARALYTNTHTCAHTYVHACSQTLCTCAFISQKYTNYCPRRVSILWQETSLGLLPWGSLSPKRVLLKCFRPVTEASCVISSGCPDFPHSAGGSQSPHSLCCNCQET